MNTNYRGSIKHKNRPARGRKGTLCPEWTHAISDQGLSDNVAAHPWNETAAQRLFGAAVIDVQSNKRYATERGLAFVAQETNDGTWHGYPVPWNQVPSGIKDDFLAKSLVTKRDVKRFMDFNKDNLAWALDSSDE